MSNKFIIEDAVGDKSAICAEILASLPQWFGITRSNAQYALEAGELPMFVAVEERHVPGMIVLKPQTPFAVEILVFGVRPECHRKGIGRALVRRAEEWVKAAGAKYLTVKTRGPSVPDANYEKTRLFYVGVGFVPLEEFPTFWDAQNPCLFMVKPLA